MKPIRLWGLGINRDDALGRIAELYDLDADGKFHLNPILYLAAVTAAENKVCAS